VESVLLDSDQARAFRMIWERDTQQADQPLRLDAHYFLPFERFAQYIPPHLFRKGQIYISVGCPIAFSLFAYWGKMWRSGAGGLHAPSLAPSPLSSLQSDLFFFFSTKGYGRCVIITFYGPLGTLLSGNWYNEGSPKTQSWCFAHYVHAT